MIGKVLAGCGALLVTFLLFGAVFMVGISHRSRPATPQVEAQIFSAGGADPVPPPAASAPRYAASTASDSMHIDQVGDTVHVGYWTYRVNRSQWSPFLSDGFSVHRADADYLILDITARNDDSSESTLPPMILVNSRGQRFSESSDAAFVNGAFGPLKSLNPGVESRGLVIFDAPAGDYALELEGGFESGDRTRIALPLNRSSAAADQSAAGEEAQ